MDGLLDLPDLSLWSPAVGGRVHDDGVVVVTPAYLPLHELGAVVHQPPYGRVLQPGGDSVLPCPGDHALGGVHVGHGGPGRSGSQCGAPCIGEEVQHLDRASGLPYLFGKPVPVGCLLREEACVHKAEGLQVKGQAFVTDGPLGGEVKELPLPASLFAAVVVGVAFSPALQCLWSVPDDLRVRADQEIVAPALQLFSSAAVQHLVILPVVSYPHISQPRFFIIDPISLTIARCAENYSIPFTCLQFQWEYVSEICGILRV